MSVRKIPDGPAYISNKDMSGLVTLSFLKAWANNDSMKMGRLGFFYPLVLSAIEAQGAKGFKDLAIQKTIQLRSGILLPLPVVMELIKLAQREGLLGHSKESKTYFLSNKVEFPQIASTSEQDKIAEDIDNLVSSQIEFASSKNLTLEKDEAISGLVDFLTVYAGLKVVKPRDDSPWNESLAACFIQSIKDPVQQEVIDNLTKGAVLYGAAFVKDFRNEKELTFSNTTVYLDTPVVLALLNYCEDSEGQFASEAVDLIRGAGAKISVYESTVDEVKNILTNSYNSFQNPKYWLDYEINRMISQQGITQGDLWERIMTLEADIESLGVNIARNPDAPLDYPIDINKLVAAISDKDGSSDSTRVKYDEKSIASIAIERRGNDKRSLFNCVSVMVTTAYSSVRSIVKWWRNDEDNIGVPPLMGLREVANSCWLIHPNEDISIRSSVLAACSSLMKPSDKVFKDFAAYYRDAISVDKPTADKLPSLVFGDAAMVALKLQEISTEKGDTTDIDHEMVFNAAKEEADRRVELLANEKTEVLRKQYEEDKIIYEDSLRKQLQNEIDAKVPALAEKIGQDLFNDKIESLKSYRKNQLFGIFKIVFRLTIIIITIPSVLLLSHLLLNIYDFFAPFFGSSEYDPETVINISCTLLGVIGFKISIDKVPALCANKLSAWIANMEYPS